MIESINIKNYKSILDLSFDVGRVNVLIGENGCGKSNILEALTLAGAAEANKLDNEFLSSRGIRATSAHLMRSAFNPDKNESIEISIQLIGEDDSEPPYKLQNDNQPYSKWILTPRRQFSLKLSPSELETIRNLSKEVSNNSEKIRKTIQILQFLASSQAEEIDIESLSNTNEADKDTLKKSRLKVSNTTELNIFAHNESESTVAKVHGREYLARIIIYSPEETALRNLYQEGQIEPLGIHGEGLLKLLKVLVENESAPSLEAIRESLSLLDWFQNISISDDDSVGILDELKVILSDRFIEAKFDQRSANEGFLFILFYSALMVSEDTPKIFAIDNVDASLNPKLCTKVMSDIVKLAKQFDKQCFLTTHNPAILDGLNLGDDEQRLFVVTRNRKGHTRLKRITVESKPVSSTGEELKLSEAFLRGYLGGLPKNF
ncbi:MAG: AAA family ATPase [Bacteroidota bacterium]